MADAANILAELSDLSGSWRVAKTDGKLTVGKGDAVLVPLDSRSVMLRDGGVSTLVNYSLSDRGGIQIASAYNQNATRKFCSWVGLGLGSPYVRNRLEVGIASSGKPVAWLPLSGDKAAIASSCASLPERIDEANDTDRIYLRPSAPKAAGSPT